MGIKQADGIGVMLMWIKGYIVIILQLMIWSGYTVIEWLSKHDQSLFNWLMFLVFVYMAFVVGNYVLKSTRKTLFITMISLFLYSALHFSLPFIQSLKIH